MQYLTELTKANDNKTAAKEIPMKKDTPLLAMGITSIKTLRKPLFHKLRQYFLRRRMANCPHHFVMTSFQDKLIVADNRDRKMYSLTPSAEGPWDMELIATF